MLSFSHLLFMSTFGARFAAHVYIYRIQYIHIAHIMPWQGRYKRGQAGKQDTAGQGRKGRTDCNLYDIHNDILRTNAPAGRAGRGGKSKVFIKNGTPGRSPTQLSSRRRYER